MPSGRPSLILRCIAVEALTKSAGGISAMTELGTGSGDMHLRIGIYEPLREGESDRLNEFR